MMSLSLAARAAALLLAVVLPLAAAPARAADEPAAGFIADLGQRTIKVLSSKLSEREREAQFRTIFDEGFDVPAISRFVLGQYWRTATEEQRRDFIALFEACANRRLRVRQQEATINLTPDANGAATLPADYLALRRVTWTGSPRVELAYVHPSYL